MTSYVRQWLCDFLFASLFRLTVKNTPQRRIISPLWGLEDSAPVTGGLQLQRASNTNNTLPLYNLFIFISMFMSIIFKH